MSKCVPIPPGEMIGLGDFLRSIHINGKPLDLPPTIETIHTNPRNQLNMLQTMNLEELQIQAQVFDMTEASTEQFDERIARLDVRLQEVLDALNRLDQKR